MSRAGAGLAQLWTSPPPPPARSCGLSNGAGGKLVRPQRGRAWPEGASLACERCPAVSTHLSSRVGSFGAPSLAPEGASPRRPGMGTVSEAGSVSQGRGHGPVPCGVGALGAGQASVLRSGPRCPVSGRSGQSRAPRPLEVAGHSEVTCRSVSTPLGLPRGVTLGQSSPRDPVSSLQPPCRGYTCPVPPGWGAGDWGGRATPPGWGWRGRGSVLLSRKGQTSLGRLRPGTWALPVLAARGPSRCPSSMTGAPRPAGPGCSEEHPHLQPRLPPASASAAEVLAPGRLSCCWVSPVLTDTSTPSCQEPFTKEALQGSAKPWAQAAGPGTWTGPPSVVPIPAPVLRLELGQSPQDWQVPGPRGASQRPTRVTT